MFHSGFSYIGLILLLILRGQGCGHSPHGDKPEEVANTIAELNY